MPYQEPDETDPLLLVGVELPAGADSSRESARVFAEEFARMGFGEEELMALFRNPFYAGPHQAWRALGEEGVRELARQAALAWGGVRFRDVDPAGEDGIIPLPVLEAAREEPAREEPGDGPRRNHG